ncbi:MAG: T9SS C-terminal target domain-containing protein, partial [Bacteroidia bacterium]
MKKFLLTLGLAVTAWISGDAQIIKSGNITVNETWTSNNIYLLSGWVYVKPGVTLTIQPGTIIKGDFVSKGALIIERDGKLIANGTVDQPIVFTSQKAVGQRSYGDWGGLILCGRASVNLPANAANGTSAGEGVIEGGVGSIYGGGTTPNDNDSSGVLRYVRIEYPGVAFQPNSEINGLTMGG